MKIFLAIAALSCCLALCLAQDDGSYVHNPAWDLTPYQLFLMRKKAEAGAQVNALPIVEKPQPVVEVAQPQPQPQRPVVTVRRPASTSGAFNRAQQQPSFQSFPAVQQQQQSFARPAAVQAVAIPAAVQAVARPAASVPQNRADELQQQQAALQQHAAAIQQLQQAQQQLIAQSPELIAETTGHPDPNFWNRAYSYNAPTYAAQAQGSSYTYKAIF